MVGFVVDSAGTHGFVFRPKETTPYTQIDLPGAIDTWAYGINAAGQIVGSFRDATGMHAFVRRPDGSFTSFEPPGTSLGAEAHAINATGQIVGLFVDQFEGQHGFFATLSGAQLCDASNQTSCTPCTRSFTPGALHVIFPNAHLWLSRSWNNAQDYYRNRACSSDLSTCIAAFEGYIDAPWLNPATGRTVPACLLQSSDTDSHRPLPYTGTARALNDADFCFVDRTLRFNFAVTSFFPNYRDIGACGALGRVAATSCAYTPRVKKGGDDD
jgi:probable HAF family extracellular repeat protein